MPKWTIGGIILGWPARSRFSKYEHASAVMVLLRLLRLVWEGFRLAFILATDRLRPARPKRAPGQLPLALARLGPTFIKFGQALSLRRDILPDDYTAALQSLQDQITPFPAHEAVREIEGALGRPVAELFAHFDHKPLAAASIAQVHTARMHDGREVVVKVRRIDIKRMIDRDMRALLALTRFAMMIMPRLRHYQPLRLVGEIWSNLRKETDFRQEARNITRFAAAFANWPTVDIPRVVDGLISESVLVQERGTGRRIDDPIIRRDGPRLARDFADVYLHQIFVLGVFHGDPHPGNLFITSEGRICFHDFGLVGVLDRAARRRLAAFTTAFVHQDADWLLDAAIELGVLAGEMDRLAYRRGLAEIITDYAALPIKEWSLADAFLRVTRLGNTQNVSIPRDFIVLMRAMFLVEHTVRILDPDFQLLETLQTKGPDVLKTAMEQLDLRGSVDRLKHDLVAGLHDVPAILAAWTRRLNQEGEGLGVSIRVHGFDGLGAHLDRSSNRLAIALVTLGLYIAGSLLMQHSIGPRILGDMPVLAALAYVLALWFTFRLARGISRSGRL
ncbi:MAG: AarF/ABC1/UbiB kinase family protein [Rhodospirillaceae bacterium]|nr:AarF/ABC1/UbiB kinase family protein [Rhodospirillaceae bacterium]